MVALCPAALIGTVGGIPFYSSDRGAVIEHLEIRNANRAEGLELFGGPAVFVTEWLDHEAQSDA